MNGPVAHVTRYLVIRAVACVGLFGLLAAIDPTVTMKVTLDSITSDAHADCRVGSYPRYVPSTHELFFVDYGTSRSRKSGILVIRNYMH